MCEEKKKKEHDEKKMSEGSKGSNYGGIWKIINRERKRRRINEGIEMREWNEYYKSLLGGVEWRVVREVTQMAYKIYISGKTKG